MPEQNFWTLWCKGRLTEADTPIIRLGTTPFGLTSALLEEGNDIIIIIPLTVIAKQQGMQYSITQCLSPSQNKLGGCGRKGIQNKSEG